MIKQNENVSEPKVWFITGTSRGFGRIWTEAALKRGDKVVATARNIAAIDDFNEKYGENVLTLTLDVTNRGEVDSAVKRAHAHFGRIDVLVNNAGYSLVGTIEEASEDEAKAVFDTNVFGAVSVIKAVLPLMRSQGKGHIVGVSSSLGHFTMPVIGYYSSTKWAFEAIHESLAEEVKSFGIKVTIVEPGAYATEFGSESSLKFASNLDMYTALKEQFFKGLQAMEQGDPNATPNAIFRIVDSNQPPLRFLLGSTSLPWLRGVYEQRLEEWEAWHPVSASAQGLSLAEHQR